MEDQEKVDKNQTESKGEGELSEKDLNEIAGGSITKTSDSSSPILFKN